MEELLRLVGALVVRSITQRIRTNRVTPGTAKAGTTLVQRGRLMRSIRYRVEGDVVVVSAGNATIPYARIHHEGGTIRPKNAKYLTIPLTSQAKLYKARDYPTETFIQKGIIFAKMEDGGIVPIYALKKSVTIPARPYMFIDNDDVAKLKAQVGAWVKGRVKE